MKIDFLICSERSGSNLLTKIIDSHTNYCGPSPAHLIRAFSSKIMHYGDLNIDANWVEFVNDFKALFDAKIASWQVSMTLEELTESSNRSLFGLIEKLYFKEAFSHGKKDVFIKEIRTYEFAQREIDELGESKFIWLVRDPRDMALSWSRSPVHRGDIVRGSNIWRTDQSETLKLYRSPLFENRIYQLKYEDLISDPETAVKNICSFLEIDFEVSMLSFYLNDLSKKNATQTDNWKNLNKGIMSTNSQKFLRDLDKNQISYIEYLCKNEMGEFGYRFTQPLISQGEFLELEKELKLGERQVKEEYELIPESEKQKRKHWMTLFKRIQCHGE